MTVASIVSFKFSHSAVQDTILRMSGRTPQSRFGVGLAVSPYIYNLIYIPTYLRIYAGYRGMKSAIAWALRYCTSDKRVTPGFPEVCSFCLFIPPLREESAKPRIITPLRGNS